MLQLRILCDRSSDSSKLLLAYNVVKNLRSEARGDFNKTVKEITALLLHEVEIFASFDFLKTAEHSKTITGMQGVV